MQTLTRDQLMDISRKTHALQRGHFELSSGFHSGHYLQCARVLQHPKIASRVCAELARLFDIHCVRLPLEPLHLPGCFSHRGLKRLFLAVLAVRARRVFRAYGICMPDRLLGIAFPRPGDPAALRSCLKKLPPGVSELMCHPGYAAAGSHAFSCAEREQELHVLEHPSLREAIEEEGIRLIPF